MNLRVDKNSKRAAKLAITQIDRSKAEIVQGKDNLLTIARQIQEDAKIQECSLTFDPGKAVGASPHDLKRDVTKAKANLRRQEGRAEIDAKTKRKE